MSKFRTEIKPKSSENKITYDSKVLLVGSCFSDNIGEKLANYKFKVLNNPFGVLYNPYSIYNSLNILLNNTIFDLNNLHFYNGKWSSFNHHTTFSNSNKTICLENINKALKKSSTFLKKADFLFITFGTARIYTYKKTGQIVSNCHKIPAKQFDHTLLTVDKIVELYNDILTALFNNFPKINIVFTISPIRHWKDGAFGNQLSKSVLFLAINELLKSFDNISYFPAYEIVMDDLRDYRFYEENMLHPNQTAVNYIWEHFVNSYIDKNCSIIFPDILKIANAFHHKPSETSSQEFVKFAIKITQLIDVLYKKYPYLDFTKEKNYFNQFIKH